MGTVFYNFKWVYCHVNMLFEIEISPAEHKQKFKKFAFYYRNYYEMPFEKKKDIYISC